MDFQLIDEDPPRVDGMTRLDACVYFRPRIEAAARRVLEETDIGFPLSAEDLVGCGQLGLLQAFDAYASAGWVGFEPYAVHCIVGEILEAAQAA